jgi:hypothetical protein
MITIRKFPCNGETHYAVFEGDRLIAFCNYESSAIAVRDDAIQKYEANKDAYESDRSGAER